MLPAREGFPSSLNPACTLLGNAGGLVAGPAGVIMGRFGWADPMTGQVTNQRTNLEQKLGFVMPVLGTWQRQKAFAQNGLWTLREGYEVTLASRGDFWAKFAGGCGQCQPVYANQLDGTAYVGEPGWTADSETVTADSTIMTADGMALELTAWVTSFGCPPGCLAPISSWAFNS